MNRYVLIESRDPFEDGDGHWYHRLANDLKAAGHDVSLYLVENAVFAACKAAHHHNLANLGQAGMKIYADDFALRERGIGAADLSPTVAPAAIDEIVAAMESGARIMWR
jgi:hypothetical protein